MKKKQSKNWFIRFAAMLFYITGRTSLADEILNAPPRRDYYLFGKFKPKEVLPKRLKGRARENEEFKLRKQAYENAYKKYKETGESPEEEPLTISTFFFELSNRLHYANNHMGGWEFFTTYAALFIYLALIFMIIHILFKLIF